MNIEELSGQELDALVAEKVMGWHKGYGGNWAWGERHAGAFMDFSGPSIARWKPSRGEKLSAATNDVLMKAFSDGYAVRMWRVETAFYARVISPGDMGVQFRISRGTAPTLPLALCRALVKAYTVTP